MRILLVTLFLIVGLAAEAKSVAVVNLTGQISCFDKSFQEFAGVLPLTAQISEPYDEAAKCRVTNNSDQEQYAACVIREKSNDVFNVTLTAKALYDLSSYLTDEFALKLRATLVAGGPASQQFDIYSYRSLPKSNLAVLYWIKTPSSTPFEAGFTDACRVNFVKAR